MNTSPSVFFNRKRIHGIHDPIDTESVNRLAAQYSLSFSPFLIVNQGLNSMGKGVHRHIFPPPEGVK